MDKNARPEKISADAARIEASILGDATTEATISDAIGNPPSWTLTSGTTVLFCVVAVASALACLIKYPETIVTKVSISSARRPVILTARASGEIFLLSATQGQKVKPGDTLGYIKDNVDLQTLLLLKRLLKNPLANVSTLRMLSSNPNVGSFQTELQDLVLELERMELFQELNTEEIALQRLRSDRSYRQRVYQTQLRQLANEKEMLKLSITAFKRDSILFADRVNSRLDYERAHNTLLQALTSYNLFTSELLNQEGTLTLLEKQIEETGRLLETKRWERRYSMESRVRIIEEEIEFWGYTRMLVSPMEATVYLDKLWENAQHVNQGDEILYLAPVYESAYGYAYIDQVGLGKVSKGCKVIIKLNNYPFQEFGILRGAVDNISSIHTANGYLMTIRLTNSLTTTYNKELAFTQDMVGVCEVIVRDTSLMSRLFYPLKYIFSDK